MILKFINSIQILPASFLKNMLRVSASEVILDTADLPFTNIAFKKPAQMTISDKVDDGNRLFTVKLQFSTILDWLPKFNRVAVVATAVDGTTYLIGTDKQPFPMITQQQNHPDAYKESELTDITVTWSTPVMPPTIKRTSED